MSKKEDIIQLLKFVGFSISAGAIQVGVFSIMDAIGIVYWISYLVALVCSVVWSFTLNREFTFKSANNVPVAMMKLALFYAVFTPLSTWGGDALTRGGWNEFLVLALTMLLNLVLEFLYSKFFVFRGSINTNKRANKETQENQTNEQVEEK